MFAVYYFSFKFCILKFNILTLGRNEEDFCNQEENANHELTNQEICELIVTGLGGLENIVEVDNCISRLRVEIKDNTLVNLETINKTKPNGIIEPDKNNIHIVYGGRITKIRNIVDNYMQ